MLVFDAYFGSPLFNSRRSSRPILKPVYASGQLCNHAARVHECMFRFRHSCTVQKLYEKVHEIKNDMRICNFYFN